MSESVYNWLNESQKSAMCPNESEWFLHVFKPIAETLMSINES